MKQPKQHQTPEFTVIRHQEQNLKFFVASEFSNASPATTYTMGNTSEW